MNRVSRPTPDCHFYLFKTPPKNESRYFHFLVLYNYDYETTLLILLSVTPARDTYFVQFFNLFYHLSSDNGNLDNSGGNMHRHRRLRL